MKTATRRYLVRSLTIDGKPSPLVPALVTVEADTLRVLAVEPFTAETYATTYLPAAAIVSGHLLQK